MCCILRDEDMDQVDCPCLSGHYQDRAGRRDGRHSRSRAGSDDPMAATTAVLATVALRETGTIKEAPKMIIIVEEINSTEVNLILSVESD